MGEWALASHKAHYTPHSKVSFSLMFPSNFSVFSTLIIQQDGKELIALKYIKVFPPVPCSVSSVWSCRKNTDLPSLESDQNTAYSYVIDCHHHRLSLWLHPWAREGSGMGSKGEWLWLSTNHQSNWRMWTDCKKHTETSLSLMNSQVFFLLTKACFWCLPPSLLLLCLRKFGCA